MKKLIALVIVAVMLLGMMPMMAMAADTVIVGAVEVVETGSLDPDNVRTSGIFVDAVVGGEKPWQM